MADLSRVQQAVQSTRVGGVRNLTARQNGSMIEVHGQADSIAAKQNAMRAITERAGDQGISNMIQVATERSGQGNQGALNTSQPQTPAGMMSASEGRTHRVRTGETLSHIAQKYYGKAGDYRRIFEANRDQIEDPDKIREGMTIKIP